MAAGYAQRECTRQERALCALNVRMQRRGSERASNAGQVRKLTAAEASALRSAGLERRMGCPVLFMLRDEDGTPFRCDFDG